MKVNNFSCCFFPTPDGVIAKMPPPPQYRQNALSNKCLNKFSACKLWGVLISVLCIKKTAPNVLDNSDYLLFHSWILDSFKP
jgi:hypothetical protein